VVLFVAPLAAAVLALFVHYGLLQSDIGRLQEDIKQKQSEKAQMAQLEKEIQEFEAKQALLQGRIQVIEQLKRNQAGPVTLLEAVGRTVSLTGALWLTSMEEKAANQIEFKGVAGSIDAVADFITNLDRSGYFENVEMQETIQQPQREGAANFEFTLSARFSLPAPPEAESGPEAAAPAAAGGNP
jgi:Tfp pilus assembly protein PilN